jgi:hypothetical protein
MIGNCARVIAGCVIVLGLGASMAMTESGVQSGIRVPDVPTDIEVPMGYAAYFKGHAIGTQNYICLPTLSGFAWTFVAPEATLFKTSRGALTQQLVTHFLSPNPFEGGVSRATWQDSSDSSRVWARLLKSSSDANFVEAGAIPWLLLTVVGAADGPQGGSFLTHTKLIHRLNTVGGVAPATGCSQATEVGALMLVPYAADYFFYRQVRAR